MLMPLGGSDVRAEVAVIKGSAKNYKELQWWEEDTVKAHFGVPERQGQARTTSVRLSCESTRSGTSLLYRTPGEVPLAGELVRLKQ